MCGYEREQSTVKIGEDVIIGKNAWSPEGLRISWFLCIRLMAESMMLARGDLSVKKDSFWKSPVFFYPTHYKVELHEENPFLGTSHHSFLTGPPEDVLLTPLLFVPSHRWPCLHSKWVQMQVSVFLAETTLPLPLTDSPHTADSP